MKYYVGLDVAMKETAIYVVDDQRRIVREGKTATEPEGIAAFLSATGVSFERVGIEAGPLAPWLCHGGPAGDLHPRPAHEGGGQRHAGQDRPDRCSQHRVRDAGRLVPAGASEAPRSEEAAAAPVQPGDAGTDADRPRQPHP